MHQWLVGPRRIGKTSVAKAALARLRDDGCVALDVDLSKLDITTSGELADELAKQAQVAGVGVSPVSQRAFRRTRAKAPQARRIGRALEGLGFEGEGQALEAVSSILAGADNGSPGLSSVLEALSVHGHATARQVAILLDEVHLLANLPGGEGDVASWCRDENCAVVFVFAGSEESAVRELRERGRPLAPVGREFHLPDIGSEDWLHGLRLRFEEVGVRIGDAELFAIVDASDGHPRRTMLIASYAHTKAMNEPDQTASDVVVELAIGDARKDRAWD